MNNADRKRQLIAQGRIYRAEVMHAKEVVQEGLHPESMTRRIMSQVALAGLAALRARSGIALPGLNLGTALPLVLRGVSMLAKRKTLIKPLLKSTVVAGTVAGIIALLARGKKGQTASDDNLAA